MSRLLHFGDTVAMDAYLYPDKVGARDLTRSLTFRKKRLRSVEAQGKAADRLDRTGGDNGDPAC